MPSNGRIVPDENGKISNDNQGKGDVTTRVAGAIAPIVIGKVMKPVESPKSLKDLGGIPEAKSVTPLTITDKIINKPTQSIKNRFPDEPPPSDGRVLGIAKIENGKIKANFKIPSQNQVDFVVDKKGNLILGKKHSFLSGNEEVQAAGTMKVVNGKVKAVTNLSGHYQPSLEQSQKFPDILRGLGLDLKSTKLEISVFENTSSGYVIGRGKIVVNEYLRY